MKRAKIQVMYIGECLQQFSGRILQVFRDKQGKKYHFSGIKGLWFGELYEMNNEKMERRPKALGTGEWGPHPKDRAEYEAQKIVVKQARQNRRKEMTLKKPHEDIVRAVGLLRPFYQGLDDVDRNRFMRWVANECSKKKK